MIEAERKKMISTAVLLTPGTEPSRRAREEVKLLWSGFQKFTLRRRG